MNQSAINYKAREIPTIARVALWAGVVGTILGVILVLWVGIFIAGSRRSRQQEALEEQRLSLQRLEAATEVNKRTLADLKAQLQDARKEARNDYDVSKQNEQHVDYATHLVARELPKKASTQDVLQLQERLRELELRTDVDSQIQKEQQTELEHLAVQSGQELERMRGSGRINTEFETHQKRVPIVVSGVTLELEEANPSLNQFSVRLRDSKSDWVEKKNTYLNEPIYWYFTGSRDLAEIVVTELGRDSLKGYVSIPKGKDPDVPK
jgi:hypothetical protein